MTVDRPVEKIGKLKLKIFILIPLTFVLLLAVLLISAGSIYYWQAWTFCAVLLIPVIFVITYFLHKSPDFLERRMMFREKEAEQKAIIKIANIPFFVGLMIPGLDFRFGWSHVPLWLVIAAHAGILLSYSMVFFAFKENAFAGRTVEIFKGQKVIDTGPYAMVRHPMYAGLIPLFLFVPLALGSYWGLLLMIPVCAAIIFRMFNEEKVLRRDLPGYAAYCEKVRYRLVPNIW